MKKQPENKGTTNVGEINKLCSSKTNTVETIYHILGKFNIEEKLKVVNRVKVRGYKIMELITILIVMPYFKVRIDNVSQKKRGKNQSEAQKDSFYDLKNNELINWRLVLMTLVKQFGLLTQAEQKDDCNKNMVLVADDTTAKKTGLKIENVSKVHDHTTQLYCYGFKILVLGLFDGKSFIPVDFSIHREKGQGSSRERKRLNTASTKLEKTRIQLNSKILTLKEKKTQGKILKKKYPQDKDTNKKQLQINANQILRLSVKIKQLKKQLVGLEKEHQQAKNEYHLSLKIHPRCGLKTKERKEQFKKTRIKNSYGYIRAKEVDDKKTDILLEMIKRAIKAGVKAQYFMADSWFFCRMMIKEVRTKKLGLHYLGMVPQRDTIHYNCDDKYVNSKYLLKENKVNTQRCRKYRSKYIQLEVEFAEEKIQLYFVKLGRAKQWKLLATTDLNLNFIRLFELYQIRWSIEVFFKESKQYLGLGKCQSLDFDAQICSTTLTMIQYILLCYYKRIHYQQKLDGIFEDISYQTMEATIVERMLLKFIELLDVVAQIIGVEPLELYIQLIHDEQAKKIIKELNLVDFMEFRKSA